MTISQRWSHFYSIEPPSFKIDEEDGDHYGILPDTYTLKEFSNLLRLYQYDHEVVSFLASVLLKPVYPEALSPASKAGGP